MPEGYGNETVRKPSLPLPEINRRNFLKISGALVVATVTGGVIVNKDAVAGYLAKASSSQPGLLDGVELPAYLEGNGNRVTMKLPQVTDKWAIESSLGEGNEDRNYKYFNMDNNMPGMIYGIDKENEILHVVVDRAFAEENAALVKVGFDYEGTNVVPLKPLINDRPDILVYFIDVPLSGHDVVGVVNVDNRVNQPGVTLKRQN